MVNRAGGGGDGADNGVDGDNGITQRIRGTEIEWNYRCFIPFLRFSV